MPTGPSLRKRAKYLGWFATNCELRERKRRGHDCLESALPLTPLRALGRPSPSLTGTGDTIFWPAPILFGSTFYAGTPIERDYYPGFAEGGDQFPMIRGRVVPR